MLFLIVSLSFTLFLFDKSETMANKILFEILFEVYSQERLTLFLAAMLSIILLMCLSHLTNGVSNKYNMVFGAQ